MRLGCSCFCAKYLKETFTAKLCDDNGELSNDSLIVVKDANFLLYLESF